MSNAPRFAYDGKEHWTEGKDCKYSIPSLRLRGIHKLDMRKAPEMTGQKAAQKWGEIWPAYESGEVCVR